MCHKRQPHVVPLAPQRQPVTERLHSSCLLLSAAPENVARRLEVTLYICESQVLPEILVAARECKCKHQASQELCQEHNEPIQPVMSCG